MKTLGRRTVLRGIGGIGISLPLLEAMGGKAFADPTGAAKRLVIFGVPLGFGNRLGENPSKNIFGIDPFWPTGGETDFVMSEVLQPLEPHRKDLLILRNLGRNLSGLNSHDTAVAHAMCGVDSPGNFKQNPISGMSIDQYIGQRVPATANKSLQWRVPLGTGNFMHLSWSSPSTPNYPVFNPQKAFYQLFKNFTPGPRDPNDPEVVAARKLTERKKSIIDFVKSDFGRLNSKLGKSDRTKLDAHLSSIREVERKIQIAGDNIGTVSASCSKPDLKYGAGAPPIPADGVNWNASDRYWEQSHDNATLLLGGELFIALVAEALACDLTRMITLQWATWSAQETYPFLGISTDNHALSHGGGDAGIMQSIKIYNWYAKQFAALIEALKRKQDGTGTLLNNTALVWIQELSAGNHNRENQPTIIAGQCGGYFRTGRYIQYPIAGNNIGCCGGGTNAPNQRLVNDLHLTMIEAMGLPPPPGNVFGNPAWCKGPLPNLT